nr:PC4 and SFRS1 interacting protein [Hymenolepis microstoma]
MFQPGDKVFAKMKGFPFWPARVDPVPDHVEVPRGKLPVFFYGTHQVSFLPSKSLVSFEANRDSHGKRKNVARAMEEIDLDPDVLFLGKDPSAEAFWESMYPRSSAVIELKPLSVSSRSTSPLPIKALKRKTSKATRAPVNKRRRSDAKDDDCDSLSSLSDFEDVEPKVTTLDVETLKRGLFSNKEPTNDKSVKVSRKKKRQTSKDTKEPYSLSKRSKLYEKAMEIEPEPTVKPESTDISSIEIKQTSTSALSLGELFDVKQPTNDPQQKSKPSRTHFPSPLVDGENSSDISDGYVSPITGKYRQSNFRTKRAVSSLSDSDDKSLDEDLNRNNEMEPSLSYVVNGNAHIHEHADFESITGGSVKSPNKSVCSELNSGHDSPVREQLNEIKSHENNHNTPTRTNSVSPLHTDVNEAEKIPTCDSSIGDVNTVSGPSTPCSESAKQNLDFDDAHPNKTEKRKNHKRIRKFSGSESESGKSSKSSVSEKLSRKSRHDHQRTIIKKHKSQEIKSRSVERNEAKRSITSPAIDTLQHLRNLVFKLKSSLLRGRENYGAAVNVLECIRATPVTLLQLTEVWELTDCVKKCKKYRPSEEVRIAASKTIAYFQEIQSGASKEEVIKVKAILEQRNKTRKQQEHEQYKLQEPSKTPEPKSATESTPNETVVEVQVSASVTQSPIVNSSPDQTKRKFSLEALRAELDEKANSLLARLAATEARLMAERSKKSNSNETTPKNLSSSTQPVPHRKVEEALSRVDEVASRLTVDLDAGSGADPLPPPPPPPLPFSQNRLSSNRSQNSQPVDLDTRISQLMKGVITPTTTSSQFHHSESSSELPSTKLLAIREEIKRKRKATAEKKQEFFDAGQKDKSKDDVIYDLLGV